MVQPAARTIDIDAEHTLHIVSAGSGRDLVLIHGAVATSHDWIAGPFGRLAELGRVTAVDRPGHGASKRGRFEGSPHAQARLIHSALAQVGREKAVIVGHSFGGMVALAYAELFPQDTQALLLLAPIAFPEVRPAEQLIYGPRALPFWGPLWSEALARSWDRPMLSLMHRLMFAPGAPPVAWQETYSWDWMLSGQAGVANGEDAAAVHPLTPVGLIDLSRIRAPVHVLQGSSDMVVQHERQSTPLVARLPGARQTILDGAGHMIHHTHEQALVEAVREALSG